MLGRARRQDLGAPGETCHVAVFGGVSEETPLGATIRDVTMTQPWPVPPPVRARNWPAIAIAVLALAVGVVALVLELTRSGAGSSPTYTAAERAEAKTNLCEQYKIASDASYIESNGSDVALARISALNAATILEAAASNNALDPEYRSSALSLAASYQAMVAAGSNGSDDPHFLSAVDDVNAKNHTMKGLCGD